MIKMVQNTEGYKNEFELKIKRFLNTQLNLLFLLFNLFHYPYKFKINLNIKKIIICLTY